MDMIKNILVLFAMGCLPTSAFAGAKACCGGATTTAANANCMTFANLSITADQKSKLEAWQSECMKGGCTKETRQVFMDKARTILSKKQFAELKSRCDKAAAKTTQS